MKRTPLDRGTKPLQRKAPISGGGAPLKRTGPMKARTAPSASRRARDRADSPAPARTPKPRRAPRHTGPSADVRALVDRRDGGRCVRCGKPANNRDHRRTRGAGGTHGELSDTINGAAWILTLCGAGNTSGCHRWKDEHRADALREGYALPLNGPLVDAELVPVLIRGRWFRFLNDGTRVPCPAPLNNDAQEAWRQAA